MLPYAAAFLLVVVLIIFKPKKFSEGSVAVFGVLAMLLLGLLGFGDIRAALVGNELLQPFKIITILVTLALITTALDDYGFFKYASHKAILLARNNGVVLFRNFFILTIILTGFTSNDIDILTVTPVVLWFAMSTKINPLPYLFAVFVAANTSSMEFLIGNLTNIIVGSVFHLRFVDFFLVMIVPTLLTLAAQYWFLRLLFRKQLPARIVQKKDLDRIHREISRPLENKAKNVYLLVVLLLVILGSALADFFPFEIWMATAAGAILVLVSGQFSLKKRFGAIPWNVVFFALAFIIMAHKMTTLGIVGVLAERPLEIFSSVWGSLFFSGIAGALGSGLINNIPAAISLSNVLYPLTQALGTTHTNAVAYGLVVGTNLGSLFTPVGALATILWLSIIREKGYDFSMKKFVGYGIMTGTLSVLVACLAIGLEITFLTT